MWLRFWQTYGRCSKSRKNSTGKNRRHTQRGQAISVTVVRNSNATKNTIWTSRPLLGHPETFQINRRRKASISPQSSDVVKSTTKQTVHHITGVQNYRNDREDLNKIKNNEKLRFEHLLQQQLLYQPKNQWPSFCKTCPQQMGTAENWQTHYQDRYGSSSRLVTIFRTVFIVSTRALHFTCLQSQPGWSNGRSRNCVVAIPSPFIEMCVSLITGLR